MCMENVEWVPVKERPKYGYKVFRRTRPVFEDSGKEVLKTRYVMTEFPPGKWVKAKPKRKFAKGKLPKEVRGGVIHAFKLKKDALDTIRDVFYTELVVKRVELRGVVIKGDFLKAPVWGAREARVVE